MISVQNSFQSCRIFCSLISKLNYFTRFDWTLLSPHVGESAIIFWRDAQRFKPQMNQYSILQ